MKTANLLGIALWLLLSGVAVAQSAEQAVRAADQAWLKVFAARDVQATTAACAEDASVLAQGFPIATGREAIGKLFGGFFQMPGFTMEWHPTRVEVAQSGELAYTSGTYSDSAQDASGKTVQDRGKYVTIWKKQKDGSWKVQLDIFNSDLPAAP